MLIVAANITGNKSNFWVQRRINFQESPTFDRHVISIIQIYMILINLARNDSVLFGLGGREWKGRILSLQYVAFEGQATRTLTLFLRLTLSSSTIASTGLLCAIWSGLFLTTHRSAASIGYGPHLATI